MKKAINKTEREAILIGLVVESAQPKAQAVVDTLADLRKQVHEVLLENWQDNFPGISRDDQLALLRSHGGNALTFNPSVYTKVEDGEGNKCVGDFGKFAWPSAGNESAKARVSRISTEIFRKCTGTAGVFHENATTAYTSYVRMDSSYADIINGLQPSGLYDASVDLPDDCDPIVNDVLMVLYGKIQAQLQVYKHLLYEAEDAYQALGAATAPIKTAQQMADLFPEAVKHFPPSLTYVKPTKEIADPKAINEIRAKLAKGLPI